MKKYLKLIYLKLAHDVSKYINHIKVYQALGSCYADLKSLSPDLTMTISDYWANHDHSSNDKRKTHEHSSNNNRTKGTKETKLNAARAAKEEEI